MYAGAKTCKETVALDLNNTKPHHILLKYYMMMNCEMVQVIAGLYISFWLPWKHFTPVGEWTAAGVHSHVTQI